MRPDAPGATLRYLGAMKTITLAVVLAGTALATLSSVPAATAFAQEGGRAREGGERPQGERGRRGPSELGQWMEQLEEQLGQMSEALAADEVSEETYGKLLEQVCKLQAGAITAKSEMPRSMGRLEGDELAQAKVGYRAQMHALLGQLFALELAVAGGDAEAAHKALEGFEMIERDGHTKFKGRRGGPGGPGGRRDR